MASESVEHVKAFALLTEKKHGEALRAFLELIPSCADDERVYRGAAEALLGDLTTDPGRRLSPDD